MHALEMLKEGSGREDICREFFELYGLSPSMSDRYLHLAGKELMKYWEEKMPYLPAEIAAKFTRIYQNSMKFREFGAANGALNGLAKIAGYDRREVILTDGKKKEESEKAVKGSERKMEDLSDDELLGFLEEEESD